MLKDVLHGGFIWLAGETAAAIWWNRRVYLTKANKNIVTVRYIISQKDDKEFSVHAASLINGYISYVKSYNGYNTVVNLRNLNKILAYLHRYPLGARTGAHKKINILQKISESKRVSNKKRTFRLRRRRCKTYKRLM